MPLYERPDSPNWYVTIGENVRVSTGIAVRPSDDEEECARYYALAQEYERALTERIWRLEKLGDCSALAFKTAADKYLKSDGKARKRERECLEWIMDCEPPAGPQLGVHAIGAVADYDALEALRDLALAQGWGPGTVDRHLSTVSAVLNFCVPKYLPNRVSVPLIRAEAGESVWLRPDLIPKICSHLPWHLELAARFAILTLLRMRAMLSLLWRHVYVKERWAEVLPGNQKNRKPFGFALTDQHIEVLRHLKAFQRKQYEEHVRRCKRLHWRGDVKVRDDWDFEHVFTWHGRKIVDCNTAAYQRALKLAGAPPGANWHSLRHTGAMYARFGGVSLADLMALGGWRSIASVKPYMHVDPALLRPASDKVAGRLPRLTNPSQEVLGEDDDWSEESLMDQAVRMVERAGIEPATYALRRLPTYPPDYKPLKENKELNKRLEAATGRLWLPKAANGT